MREKRRLKMFENRVLRSTSGAKREEVTGNWRRLHMTILFTKFYSGDQIQKNELGEACSMYVGEERYIQGFGGET